MTQVEDTTSEVNGSGSGEVDLTKLQAGFGFTAPLEMRMLAEEKAAEVKLPLSTYLRNIVAEYIGYTLPVAPSGSRGLSEEEKKARLEAQKQQAKEERRAVAEQLKAHRESLKPAPTSTNGETASA